MWGEQADNDDFITGAYCTTRSNRPRPTHGCATYRFPTQYHSCADRAAKPDNILFPVSRSDGNSLTYSYPTDHHRADDTTHLSPKPGQHAHPTPD
jgi:hypothetical protein